MEPLQGVYVKTDPSLSESNNYFVFLCFWSTERMHAQLFIKAATQNQSSP